MNVVLAVAVNSYDESIEKRKCYRADLSKALLSEAFTLLDHNGENSVSRESIMNVSQYRYSILSSRIILSHQPNRS